MDYKTLRISQGSCEERYLQERINDVLLEYKSRESANRQRYIDDARNELFARFREHPEKLWANATHAKIAIRYALKDILREKSANGVTGIPREVYRFPKGEEKDTRRYVLEFSNADYDPEAQGDHDPYDDEDVIGSSSQDPYAVLRSTCIEAITAELYQHSGFQQLLRASQARTLAEKATVMGCKPAKVRERMNEAYQVIRALVRERMGRLGD